MAAALKPAAPLRAGGKFGIILAMESAKKSEVVKKVLLSCVAVLVVVAVVWCILPSGNKVQEVSQKTEVWTNLVHSAVLPEGLKWQPGPDYVDTPDPVASPNAKKGGTIRFNGGMPPKSFNSYTDNNTYTRMTFSLMYETLLGTDSETLEFAPSLAKRWAVSEDGTEFYFEIDDRAMWSDGVPVSAYDVKWTFDTVMEPMSDTGSWKMIFGRFESPEILDDYTLLFRKKGNEKKDWRDLMMCGCDIYVMPKHAFEGQDFNKIDLLNAPVSGPYSLTRVVEQVETQFTRNKNWWRGDWPSGKNVCNFDNVLIRYHIDNENAFEALKKHSIDVYPVYTARIMNNETHGEKFEKNWILKRRVANHQPSGFQGFAMNMRRWPFDDKRVRIAMAKLVDREMMNRTMMFNEYFLQKSIFSDIYDDTHPCENPFYLYDFDGAKKLLEEAGFAKNPKTGKLEKDGRQFKFTFLSRSSTEDKFLSSFNAALMELGIDMHIERKDFAAWMRDMDGFCFDMTWQSWGGSLFKTPEIMWRSTEADRKQSNNTVGFKSEEVDKLLDAEKLTTTMEERNAYYRQIDKLVTEEAPYAFLWNMKETRLLYWNKFGMPDTVLSRYSNEEAILTYWWFDEDKAAELKEAMDNGLFLPKVEETVEFDAAFRAISNSTLPSAQEEACTAEIPAALPQPAEQASEAVASEEQGTQSNQ